MEDEDKESDEDGENKSMGEDLDLIVEEDGEGANTNQLDTARNSNDDATPREGVGEMDITDGEEKKEDEPEI